jgi:hypothetical protein
MYRPRICAWHCSGTAASSTDCCRFRRSAERNGETSEGQIG